MSLHTACEISLPHWLEQFVGDWQEPLDTDVQRMHLAVSLSAENVQWAQPLARSSANTVPFWLPTNTSPRLTIGCDLARVAPG